MLREESPPRRMTEMIHQQLPPKFEDNKVCRVGCHFESSTIEKVLVKRCQQHLRRKERKEDSERRVNNEQGEGKATNPAFSSLDKFLYSLVNVITGDQFISCLTTTAHTLNLLRAIVQVKIKELAYCKLNLYFYTGSAQTQWS